MDIHQIHYLITIVDNGFNLTKSARILNISQPALSKTISEIEKNDKIKIFHRGKGRINGLTAQGKTLIEDGKRVESAYHQLLKNIRDEKIATRSTVKLGIEPSVLNSVLLVPLQMFQQEHPEIALQLFEANATELIDQLLTRKIDLAIGSITSTDSNIQPQTLIKYTASVWFDQIQITQNTPQTFELNRLVDKKIITLPGDTSFANDLAQKFAQFTLNNPIFFQTNSLELITRICQQMPDTFAILPTSIQSESVKHLEKRKLKTDLNWEINISSLRYVESRKTIDSTKKWFISYFKLQNQE